MCRSSVKPNVWKPSTISSSPSTEEYWKRDSAGRGRASGRTGRRSGTTPGRSQGGARRHTAVVGDQAGAGGALGRSRRRPAPAAPAGPRRSPTVAQTTPNSIQWRSKPTPSARNGPRGQGERQHAARRPEHQRRATAGRSRGRRGTSPAGCPAGDPGRVPAAALEVALAPLAVLPEADRHLGGASRSRAALRTISEAYSHPATPARSARSASRVSARIPQWMSLNRVP